MILPEDAFPEGWKAPQTQPAPLPRRPSNAGVVAAAFGILFGLLGIFTIGLIFVPLAALCSVVGLLRALAAPCSAGVGLSLVGGFLTLCGALVSPSVWALLAGGILAAALVPSAPAVSPAPMPRPASAIVASTRTPASTTLSEQAQVPSAATRDSEPRPNSQIVLDRVSGRVMRLSRLLPTDMECDDDREAAGRVVARDMMPNSQAPVGIAIQSLNGRRLYVNVDVNLNGRDRPAANAILRGFQDLASPGNAVVVRYSACGGSGRIYLDTITQAPTGQTTAEGGHPELRRCTQAFVDLWNDDRRAAFARMPIRPCIMQGETGQYVCDKGGCVRN